MRETVIYPHAVVGKIGRDVDVESDMLGLTNGWDMVSRGSWGEDELLVNENGQRWSFQTSTSLH